MISPEAHISPSAKIGHSATVHPFSTICERAIIGHKCTIGHNVFIGRAVHISHSCRIQGNVFIPEGYSIGHHTFIGPGAVFCNVKKPDPEHSQSHLLSEIKPNVIIGAGAVILPGLLLCEGARVGAGAVVTHSIHYKEIWYVGNPAKPQISR